LRGGAAFNILADDEPALTHRPGGVCAFPTSLGCG
jgi:hypothetical protein